MGWFVAYVLGIVLAFALGASWWAVVLGAVVVAVVFAFVALAFFLNEVTEWPGW